ncbi:hypothetical protein B0H13DRAFT_2678124 [Mycena leptocephala]|nr:hypothetical protein B0H13DRAFT_2678124 [Mycena leptocephala]
MENYGDPSGGYNFPPQQYMVPPPAPYMAPQQFYANLTALHSPVPTSETPVPTPCKRVASNSQPQSPPKHKRGRPAGSTKAKMAAAQKAKPAAKSQPKVAQRNSVKENIPPPEMIELSDSDNEIEKTDTGKIRHWQPDERTTFYRFLLAFDPVGDKRFVQHQVDPGRVYRQASEILFSGERSAASIKSMWLCSLNAFQWIRAFESFTGNGGGDPDSDDPEAIKKKLAAARKLGLPLGSLKPSTITEWEDNGWWDLFNDRFPYDIYRSTQPLIAPSMQGQRILQVDKPAVTGTPLLVVMPSWYHIMPCASTTTLVKCPKSARSVSRFKDKINKDGTS